MLKNEYAKQEDIPENQRGAYVQKGDRWVLDELDAAHPLVANSRTLKTEKQQAETAKANAERERDDAKTALASANVLQTGQRAVAKADADLIEAVKAKGVTSADAFNVLHAEHGTFKTKAEEAQRRENFETLRKKVGHNENAPAVYALIQDFPEVEDRDVTTNGKTEKVPHAKVVTKNAGGQDEVSYKPFTDYFKERHAALLPSVTSKAQLQTPTQGVDDPPKNEEKSFAGSIVASRYAPKKQEAAAGN